MSTRSPDEPEESQGERFAFTWPGKRRAVQELDAPPRARLLPDFSRSPGDPCHLFIEGDNLEALKLLRQTHAGTVKLIYIDPPYNTGGSFVYRDQFPSPREGGRAADERGKRHGAWLSMIYPRLRLAHDLLREDGAIFVSIDDHEVHHLRLLMDELFGEACFKNCIIFRRGVKSVQAQFESTGALAVGHEYVLFYARSPATRFPKLLVPRDEARPGTWNNHWRGTERPTMRYELFGITPSRGQWRWSRDRSLAAVANYERLLVELGTREPTAEQIDGWYTRERLRNGHEPDLLRLSKSGKPEHFVPPTDSRLGSDLWTDIEPRGSAELDALFGTKVFDHPKPVALIRRILQIATEPHAADLVLDFFAGACTTAHAVLAANRDDCGNRRFIVVQSPEPLPVAQSLPDGTTLRTIADVGRERIRRVVARSHAGEGLGSVRPTEPTIVTGDCLNCRLAATEEEIHD